MRKLQPLQTRALINEVYALDEPGAGGACHEYSIVRNVNGVYHDTTIIFQCGPRSDPHSSFGVLDNDVLEIVRDRLKGFQEGPLPSRETAMALMHVEEALLWMHMRAEDRLNRGVLGTMEK